MEQKKLFDWVFAHKVCPSFHQMPSDKIDDFEFLADHWVFCEQEEGCPYLDYCPVVPKEFNPPEIIKEKK